MTTFWEMVIDPQRESEVDFKEDSLVDILNCAK